MAGQPRVSTRAAGRRPGLAPEAAAQTGYASKVPEITAAFWVIKILTTGMGETASDFMAHTIGPLVAVPLGLVGLVLALTAQLRAPAFRPGTYWLAVTMVSVFGTMAADALHVAAGIPYVVSCTVFALVLTLVMWRWRSREGTLSIHSIRTPSRERYYWAAVLVTFALGTAAGDLTAVTFGWGYLLSSLVFAVLFALPLVGQHRFGMPEVVAFWSAYVLTRPLGASVADWLALPPARGGLGLGTGPVTLLWAVAIGVLVAVVSRHASVKR